MAAEQRENDAKRATYHAKTGHEIQPFAQETAAAQNGRPAAEEGQVVTNPGWALLLIGLCFAAAGTACLLLPHLPWVGRLPGDIRVEGEHFRFYFPLTTCLLLSLILTAILWLVRLLSR